MRGPLLSASLGRAGAAEGAFEGWRTVDPAGGAHGRASWVRDARGQVVEAEGVRVEAGVDVVVVVVVLLLLLVLAVLLALLNLFCLGDFSRIGATRRREESVEPAWLPAVGDDEAEAQRGRAAVQRARRSEGVGVGGRGGPERPPSKRRRRVRPGGSRD